MRRLPQPHVPGGAYAHGLNAHEFATMVRLGLSPLQSIQAATIKAADLVGWSDRVGVVENGKFADLIAVNGDPSKMSLFWSTSNSL